MSRYHSYLNSAVQVLTAYAGEEPLSSFLKKIFSANKKFGSKDRKQVSHLCYCYYRLGKSIRSVGMADRIVIGLWLCSATESDLLTALKPEWADKTGWTIDQKLELIGQHYPVQEGDIPLLHGFPLKTALSSGFSYEAFNRSFFIQPDLFLRLRPGKEHLVKQQLDAAGISYAMQGRQGLSLSNSSAIDQVIVINRDAVIQDASSQQTGGLLDDILSSKQTVWDCCAASGGKSMMVYDMNTSIELTVSDIRKSILVNLRRRFEEAGIRHYTAAVMDVSSDHFQFPATPAPLFSLIIADVPCTGSGTWSRTPEQLYYFDPQQVSMYSALQEKIVRNASRYLAPGGHLLYITCSVFHEENEDRVQVMEKEMGLTTIAMQTFAGYDHRADNMFAALLQKPL